MAIGQLLDYSRFLDPPPAERAVLLSQRPPEDLARLVLGNGMVLICEREPCVFIEDRP